MLRSKGSLPAARSNTGVYGYSPTGTGVCARSPDGTALSVIGRANFNRSARASLPANASYVDVTVPGGLASGSNVLATLQQHRSGAWVAGVQLDTPSAGRVRIRLNKVASTTHSTPVAWFVVG
jgi:hypothetical protein